MGTETLSEPSNSSKLDFEIELILVMWVSFDENEWLLFLQAYNLSRDHKPGLEIERERILKAGGFIHSGQVNGSLNLTRAIGSCFTMAVSLKPGLVISRN
ncbi:hypothetical protein OSB04_029986 [Centaurea solstitialis]|uniref:PPM-type phosphatase domain-containing protein n=1 Tax=Centaurea solstitialis TaxID=347529 RepID=A0AA38S7K4_9ASTR|nr:hypothetical protein OSB04_029986 [Centaurea solstitialis]